MNSADVARKWLELINKQDVGGLIKLYAPDLVIRDPGLPEPLRGADNYKFNAENVWWQAFPDLKFEMKSLIAEGNMAAMELELVGTHKGPLPGPAGEIPATNRPFRVPGVGWWQLNEQGLIAEERRYYDLAGFMQQLGVGAAVPEGAAAR